MFRQISRLIQRRAPQAAPEADPRILEARRLLAAGQLDQAERAGRKITATEPQNAEALGLLGKIAVHRGRHELAIRHLSRAIDIDPNQPTLRQGLGIAYYNAGKLPEAIRSFEQAIALNPQEPAGHNNLGNCYKHQREYEEAAGCYRKAMSLDPKNMAAYINLGDVLRRQGQLGASIETLRKALGIRKDLPEVHFNLGLALAQTGDYEQAIGIYREVAAKHPTYPALQIELGLALSQLKRTEEAIACFREAIAGQPDSALAHNCLGAALLTRNDTESALACFRKALAIKPDFARVHSNLLMTMNYQSVWTQKRLYQESLQFDLRQARRLLKKPPAFANTRDKQRILRIGYVSPDFREHSVAHFTRKLIGSHNREKVEVTCYADVMKPDDFTQEFEAQSDHWLSLVGMDDAAVAERIREDGIDILVDLAGHTSDNRLLVFARKPAPVQVTWLGYPNTTGMRAMDYRLTDAVADPPGEADKTHTEKLVRLEHGFLCYQTDEPLPEVAPPPCLRQGHVTFGSFNTTKKVTADVIRIWSQILKALPGSRLLLKSDSLQDEAARARLLKAFGERGISEDRLELHGGFPGREQHMGLYSTVDIGLDPFPYNGTTTTCEALWMGVPVVTLRGERHAGRVGASIMHRIGLDELIAGSKDDYVALAQALAADTSRLAALRSGLRARMRVSPLMDVRLFAEALENAYRHMWITWCDR